MCLAVAHASMLHSVCRVGVPVIYCFVAVDTDHSGRGEGSTNHWSNVTTACEDTISLTHLIVCCRFQGSTADLPMQSFQGRSLGHALQSNSCW